MSVQPIRPVITVQVARHVLWHFGDTNLGVDGGHFITRLLATASAADTENIEKLRLGFPELIAAWESVARRPWGLDWLRGIVKADDAHAELGLDFAAAEL